MKNVFFYVSNEGDDSWSGKLPDSDRTGKDGPFKSLERARGAVKELKALGLDHSVFIDPESKPIIIAPKQSDQGCGMSA